jgi:hypothetical protein
MHFPVYFAQYCPRSDEGRSFGPHHENFISGKIPQAAFEIKEGEIICTGKLKELPVSSQRILKTPR